MTTFPWSKERTLSGWCSSCCSRFSSDNCCISVRKCREKESEHTTSKRDEKHPGKRCLEFVLCPDMGMLEIFFILCTVKAWVFSASGTVPSLCGWNKPSSEFGFRFQDDLPSPGCGSGRGGAWDWRSKQDDAVSTLGRLGSSRRAGPGTVTKPFDDCFDKRGGALERRHEGHLTHSQG